MLALTRRADTAPQMESKNPANKVFTGREVISRDDSQASSTEIQSIKPRAFTDKASGNIRNAISQMVLSAFVAQNQT